MKIDQEYLKTRLSYDPGTGSFVWKQKAGDGRSIRMWNTRFAGKQAGCLQAVPNSDLKYLKIGIDSIVYYAHRLAWLYITGEMPKLIDHRDCDGLNNSFANLRVATTSQNCMNSSIQKSHALGIKGVGLSKSGRYSSTIRAHNQVYWLGTFDTKEEAAEAYRLASIRYHGDYGRFNNSIRRHSMATSMILQ